MNFERTENCHVNQLYHRFKCVRHQIEIGVHPVIFGFRIRAGVIGEYSCPVDFCAGAEQEDVEDLFGMLLKILMNQDKPDWSIFPVQRIKPVFNDEECFTELKKLSTGAVPVVLPPVGMIKAAAISQM